MGVFGWFGNLFKRGKKAPAATPETPAPAKHSRAVPTGIKRPLVMPPAASSQPGGHVAGEVHTVATPIGKDENFVAFQCLCGKRMKAPLAHMGRRVKCPVCGRMLDIPS